MASLREQMWKRMLRRRREMLRSGTSLISSLNKTTTRSPTAAAYSDLERGRRGIPLVSSPWGPDEGSRAVSGVPPNGRWRSVTSRKRPTLRFGCHEDVKTVRICGSRVSRVMMSGSSFKGSADGTRAQGVEKGESSGFGGSGRKRAVEEVEDGCLIWVPEAMGVRKDGSFGGGGGGHWDVDNDCPSSNRLRTSDNGFSGNGKWVSPVAGVDRSAERVYVGKVGFLGVGDKGKKKATEVDDWDCCTKSVIGTVTKSGHGSTNKVVLDQIAGALPVQAGRSGIPLVFNPVVFRPPPIGQWRSVTCRSHERQNLEFGGHAEAKRLQTCDSGVSRIGNSGESGSFVKGFAGGSRACCRVEVEKGESSRVGGSGKRAIAMRVLDVGVEEGDRCLSRVSEVIGAEKDESFGGCGGYGMFDHDYHDTGTKGWLSPVAGVSRFAEKDQSMDVGKTEFTGVGRSRKKAMEMSQMDGDGEMGVVVVEEVGDVNCGKSPSSTSMAAGKPETASKPSEEAIVKNLWFVWDWLADRKQKQMCMEKADIIGAAIEAGIIFPRPSWWPKEGEEADSVSD